MNIQTILMEDNALIHIDEYRQGHWESTVGYKYFVPSNLEGRWQWSDGLLSELLERASRQLGALDTLSRFVPNIALFIHLHVTKESVVSSQIEGTRTQMDEALMREEDINPERRDDWQEVQNYTRALNYALSKLDSLPLSSRLLLQTHEQLLSGVRGAHKQPGTFRHSQNWIGGVSLQQAVFVPPHYQLVNPLMGDMEKFLHSEALRLPYLIRIAVAHYQFETIHPFLDGNGRIGRLMIPVYLVEKGLLQKPLLYMSYFFEKDRRLYYDKLMDVRMKGDMRGWICYFLEGVEQACAKGVDTLHRILKLQATCEESIRLRMGRREANALRLLTHLFQEPVLQVKDVEQLLGLTPKAAGDLVRVFQEIGVLVESTKAARNRIFVFKEYIDLF